MTLEQLFDLPSGKLEAMTDAELEEYFRPYFHITRPEQVTRKKSSSQNSGSPVVSMSPEMKKKLEQLKMLGIDVDLTKKKKK